MDPSQFINWFWVIMMFLTTAVSALIAGAAFEWYLRSQRSEKNISVAEYCIGAVLILILSYGNSLWGYQGSWKETVERNEFWNTWEQEAAPVPVTCYKDGPCYHEYSCEPYIVLVSHSSTTCDSKGENCVTTTWTTPETRYHNCPVATTETSYFITLKTGEKFEIASHCLPKAWTDQRWRDSDDFSASNSSEVVGEVSRACVGEPPLWANANARINSGHPGSATVTRRYDDPILASGKTNLSEYRDTIEKIKNAGLMPRPAGEKDVYAFYYANKVHFVGIKVTDEWAWQWSLQQFNSQLGEGQQGDTQVILVNDESVAKLQIEPADFTAAVLADWQNSEIHGDNTIAKNSTLVVIGARDGKTAWWHALTAMPTGNEDFLRKFNNPRLIGMLLDPQLIIGTVIAEMKEVQKADGTSKMKPVGVDQSKGVMADFFYGLSSDLKFVRRCMICDDPEDKGQIGYASLASEIRPDNWALFWVVFRGLAGGILIWGIMIAIGERGWRSRFTRW